jgi:hypothetical protein
MAKPLPPPPTPAKGIIAQAVHGLAFVDLLVFLASEGVGVPLATAGGAGVADLRLSAAIIGFGLGLPLMAFGFAFPIVKGRLSDAARNRIASIAAACITIAILAAFVYMIGPDIYRHVTAVSGPPALAPTSSALPPETPVTPVRMDVVATSFVPLKSGDHVTQNITMVNRSPLVAVRGFVHNGSMMVSNHLLSATEEKAWVAISLNKDDFPRPNIESEIPPGGATWFTLFSEIDEDQLKGVLDGKSFLYVFFYAKYGDSKSGLMTETDWCGVYRLNLTVQHLCQTFDRVFSTPSKKPYLP